MATLMGLRNSALREHSLREEIMLKRRTFLSVNDRVWTKEPDFIKVKPGKIHIFKILSAGNCLAFGLGDSDNLTTYKPFPLEPGHISPQSKMQSHHSGGRSVMTFFLETASPCLPHKGTEVLKLIVKNIAVVVLCAQLCLTLQSDGQSLHRAPLSMGFSRQEYWSGLPFPTPGDLPDPAVEPTSLASSALANGFFSTAPPGKPPIFFSPSFPEI